MINLYSTHCPKCIVLEKKLKNKNISYNLKDKQEDIDYLIRKGFMSAPILEIDDELYNFEQAIEYINNLNN